jgi:TRAP-type C4-dicarboxylate transport system permease small subunit
MFIGGLFLVGMILLTSTNIFVRIFWNPISGTYELMGFFGAIITAFALGYTQRTKGHIAVDVLIDTFSPRTRSGIEFINNLVSAVFFGLVAWMLVEKGLTLQRTGEVTETLRIIYYPFTFGAALGCVVLTFVLVVDLLLNLFKRNGEAQ